MKEESLSLVAHVIALLPEDWKGWAGRLFRRGTDYGKSRTELLQQGMELGSRKLVGLANREFTAAEKNLADAAKSFADCEDREIDTVLKKRALESDVSKREADARKAGAEAALMEVTAMSALYEFQKKIKADGVAILKDESGNIRFVSLPPETKELSNP